MQSEVFLSFLLKTTSYLLYPISMKLILFITIALLYHTAAHASMDKTFYLETLPKVLCQDDQYFVHCFEGGAKSCFTQVQQLAGACYEKNRGSFLKNRKGLTLKRAKLSENILMGSCVGTEYDKNNSANKKDLPKCFSQKNW